MLADALEARSAPRAALVELRDFVVASLDHHHRSEDNDLWPLLTGAAPELGDALASLSVEHEQLDVALHDLSAVPIDAADAVAAARRVRDRVHTHLSHEEPVLFPALRAHITDQQWASFSQRTIASTPPVGTHLFIGLFDEVGSADDVELVLRSLPPEAQARVPEMRVLAAATLAKLERAIEPAVP